MNDFRPTQAACSAQCAVVMAALGLGPQSTMALRALGVMSPAARAYDLRRAGQPVATMRQGRRALYVLVQEDQQ